MGKSTDINLEGYVTFAISFKVIGGVAIGGLEEQAELGWLLFFSGIFSGIVLLGLAQIVHCNFESVQRLMRMELLLVENNCLISRKP